MELYNSKPIPADCVQAKFWPELIGTCCFLGYDKYGSALSHLKEKHFKHVHRPLEMMHKCDCAFGGPCANPQHIKIGTRQENVTDCKNKGRLGDLTGRKLTEEHKANIIKSQKGIKRKPFSAQARKNISDAHKGKKLSEEHKANISKKSNFRNHDFQVEMAHRKKAQAKSRKENKT